MYNVLIADDESSICKGLCSIIDWNHYGFTVTDTAEDGEEAFAMIKEGRYHLVVTDIRMPVMDGLELSKAVRHHNPSVKILIISGYSDFSYAKKAINYGVHGYLLKPIDRDELTEYVSAIKEELDKEMESSKFSWNNINMAKEKLLFDFVSGNLDYKLFMDKMNHYEISFHHHYFNIAILEMENFYNELEKNLDEANLIKFSVRNITEEIIEQAHIGFVYEDTNGTIGILLNGDAGTLSIQNINKYMQQIISNVLEYLKIKLTISFVETFNDISMVKKARMQAKQALERRIITDDSGIIAYTAGSEENTIFDMEWDSRKLLSAIEEMNEPAVRAEIDCLLCEIINKRFTIDMVKILRNNIFFEIVALLRKYGSTDKIQYFRHEIIKVEDRHISVEETKELLAAACNEAWNELIRLQKSKHPNIATQIKKYVGQHYSEDINLKSLSCIFYMNPVYLGRLYKNTTGEAFSDYVNKTRIAEVKKMLLTDGSKISDIIKKSGYNNQEYFYRTFRKYEGIAFAEYKEKLKLK
jgi:two-component system response regulator YesN